MKLKTLLILSILTCLASQLKAQGFSEYDGGLKVKLNDSGSKYFRILLWGQFWAQYNDNVTQEQSKLDFSIRRARILMYSQISDKFLILTHFGLNSLNANNLTPLGKGGSSQLFMHGFWGEYKVAKNHSIGGGLHYWNGISRLNNQSTLNFLTLDNNRPSWATLGLSDQFARHMGVYLKGSFNRLQYRVAINEANTSSLDMRALNDTEAVYRGREIFGGKASKVFQGYFEYNFLDVESNFLPYKVGTYLGTKKVFNIGAGFFTHPNGTVNTDGGGDVGNDVNIWAIDAFYESPIGGSRNALSGYLTYQNNDYGLNYNLGPYATGNMVYGLIGFYAHKLKLQPYVSYQHRSIDALNDNSGRLGIGANYFISGHHAKLSLEYTRSQTAAASAQGLVTLQAMIYL